MKKVIKNIFFVGEALISALRIDQKKILRGGSYFVVYSI
jgi:hypothetical protein